MADDEVVKEELWKIIGQLLQHVFRHREVYGWPSASMPLQQLPVTISETVLLNLLEMLGIEQRASVVLMETGNAVFASPRKGQGPPTSALVCLRGLQLFRQQQLEEQKTVTPQQIIEQLWGLKGDK